MIIPVELREVPSGESLKSQWAQVMIALQPLIDTLPDEKDKDYFGGIIGLLIGKEPRISNISKELMYLYILKGRQIIKWDYFRENGSLFTKRYINSRIASYLNEIALSLGEDGLFIKYGIGGYSKQFVEQKIINEGEEKKKKGWLF